MGKRRREDEGDAMRACANRKYRRAAREDLNRDVTKVLEVLDEMERAVFVDGNARGTTVTEGVQRAAKTPARPRELDLPEGAIACFDMVRGARGVRFGELNKRVAAEAPPPSTRTAMEAEDDGILDEEVLGAVSTGSSFARSLSDASLPCDNETYLSFSFQEDDARSFARTPSPCVSPTSGRSLFRKPTWLSESVSPPAQPIVADEPISKARHQLERSLTSLSECELWKVSSPDRSALERSNTTLSDPLGLGDDPLIPMEHEITSDMSWAVC